MADSTGQNIKGKLKSLNVTLIDATGTKGVDVTYLMSDIVIYENIFSQTINGTMTFTDGLGFLSGYGPFPIIGEEQLVVSWQLPFDNYPIKTMAFLVNVAGPIFGANNLKHKRYVLNLCAFEHITDASTRIQQAFTQPHSSTANAIFKTLKSSKPFLVEPTRGVQHVVIPNYSPFQAMDFLRKRSISATTSSASYVFYECGSGFRFCDIEYLITMGRKQLAANTATYTYAVTDTTLQNDYVDNAAIQADHPGSYNRGEFKTLFGFMQTKKFDTIEKIKRGYFASDTWVYDPIQAQTYEFPFNIETAGNTTTLGKNYENTKAFVDYYSKFKGDRNFYVAKDSSVPDNFVEDIMGPRASYMTRLDQNIFQASAIGDTMIVAGDVINVPNLPAYKGNGEATDYDKNLAGQFLIGAIVHKLSWESYVVDYEMYKAGNEQNLN